LQMVDGWIWRDAICGHQVQLSLCEISPHKGECHVDYEGRCGEHKSYASTLGITDTQLDGLGIRRTDVGHQPQKIQIGLLIHGLPR